VPCGSASRSLPERGDLIRAELESAGADILDAESYDDEALLAVHHEGLVDFLRTAWAQWDDAAFHEDPGQADVVGLGLPTVLVQEGGYVPQTIGPLVRATLEGFEEGTGR
jgi:acetoin utilization deacetylase AcuC-like enzyme